MDDRWRERIEAAAEEHGDLCSQTSPWSLRGKGPVACDCHRRASIAAITKLLEDVEREALERAAKACEDPPVLAFGPGGSDGTRVALSKLTMDEFGGLVEDWGAFVADAIRALAESKEGRG